MKNNKKRYNLCINCFERAKVRHNETEGEDSRIWDVKIGIMQNHRKMGKRWTNVALAHPHFDPRICDCCEYVLEHMALAEEKTEYYEDIK